MSIKPLDEILKKRVIEPFVYDNRNERFIGKRTGKPIVLSNNDSSESSLKMITQTITISEDGSEIKNVTNNGGKRQSKIDKNEKRKEQQIPNQILSEISYISEQRKQEVKEQKKNKKQERKQSYGEKERSRKPASYKTQQIDFSNEKRNLQSKNKGGEQKRSQKIRRDGFIELESFDLDISSIKKGNPNDLSEMNDLGDFLGFGAKKTKPVFKTQQDDIPTKQKPEQTNTQKDEQIRIFLEQGRNIYKKQPQVIIISSGQQVIKQSQPQQPQQQLSFNNIQPVRIKAQVINISSDSQSIPQNKNKKKGNNKTKPVKQKKSSQQIIFQSEVKNNKNDGKRLKKQTVITISDSQIKINADIVEIKTNNGVNIVHNKLMEEQKSEENNLKKTQQQKSFSFANSKNGIIRQEESKEADRICSLKRSRSQASIVSQQERKQTIYEKRKREKKQQEQKKQKQKQLKNKKIEEQKKKRQNDKSRNEKSRDKQLEDQKKRKQQQKKQIQQEKKREQNRKRNQRKKQQKLKKKRQQQQKKKKQKQRKRVQQQQKQREQQQRRIQQSLIFEEDRKQRRQSLKNVHNQARQESPRKTRSQTKNKKTKATKQPKKKNPPKKKRNQSSSVDTNKSKSKKTKKTNTKKSSQSVSRTNSLMSSVSSLKSSSIDSFNSNSDQISDSSSLSDFSNNSLNTTTRGIGQRRAKNKVKRQKCQAPQTPKQQIKQTNDLTSLVQSFIGYNPSVAFNLITKKPNHLVIFAQMNTEGLLLQSMNGNYKQVKIQTLATTRNDLIQAFDRLSQKVLKKGKFWTFRNSENFTLHSTKKSNTQTILRVTITF